MLIKRLLRGVQTSIMMYCVLMIGFFAIYIALALLLILVDMSFKTNFVMYMRFGDFAKRIFGMTSLIILFVGFLMGVFEKKEYLTD